MKFLRNGFRYLPARCRGPQCGFLITPWLSTAVPWFSIALAMIYATRNRHPLLVLNDLVLPNRNDPESQVAVIECVLSEIAPALEIVRLSSFPEGPCDEAAEQIARNCTRLHLDVYSRRAQSKGDFSEQEKTSLQIARRVAARVAELFRQRRFDHFVIPGGLYGISSIYLAMGKRAGVRVASYDSGPSSLAVGIDDVAGHCNDVAKAFAPQFDKLRKDSEKWIEFEAKREFVARLDACDRYGYQNFSLDDRMPAEDVDVLIPLNIFDDAAGIQRVQCFASPGDWVMETTRHLLRRRTEKVVVREHPVASKVVTDRSLCDALEREFGEDSNFRLVRSEEPLSTYALLGAAKIVLPCASTVGIEAAALGKRVILESKVYYGELGFVESCASREEYLSGIDRHLAQFHPLSADKQKRAWECYFFSQEASFLDGSFTPQPPDFDVWVEQGFGALIDSDQVRMFAEAFIENRPSCIVQAPRIFSAASTRFSEESINMINLRLKRLSLTFAIH